MAPWMFTSCVCVLACMAMAASGQMLAGTTITPMKDYDPTPANFIGTGSSNYYKFTIGHGGYTAYSWRIDSGSWVSSATTDINNAFLASTVVTAVGPHCIEVRGSAPSVEANPAQYCWTVESFKQNDGCTFSYSINSASPVHTSDDDVTFPFQEGTNTFELTAMDMYHNSLVPNTFSWTADTMAPSVTITSAGTESVTDTARSFSYTSSDVATPSFKYQLDGGVSVYTTATTTSFATGTFPVNECAQTEHSFGVMSIDTLGNEGDMVTYKFMVEPIDTAIELSNAVTGTSVIQGSQAIFSIAATVLAGATPSSFGYEYSVDGGSYTRGKHFPKFGVSGLSEGTHTIMVRAISTTGCKDPTPATMTFSVDTTPPTTTATCPMGPSKESNVVIYGTVEDMNVIAAGTQYRLNDNPYSPLGSPMVPCAGCPANTFAVTLTGLADGTQTLYIKSVDAAGNPGSEFSCTWDKDGGAAPMTAIVSGAPTPMPAGDSATFVYTCGDEQCIFFSSLNMGDYQLVHGDREMFHDLPEGLHTLKVYAQDIVGNVDPTPASYTWSVYGPEMYSAYMKVAGFKSVLDTPLSYEPRPLDYVHDVHSNMDAHATDK